MLVFNGAEIMMLKYNQPPSKTSTHARFRGWLVVGKNLILKSSELVIIEYIQYTTYLWRKWVDAPPIPPPLLSYCSVWRLWWAEMQQHLVLSWHSLALSSGV